MMIQVFDNFLPEEDAKMISDVVTRSNFAWFYSETVAYDDTVGNDDFYFYHLLYFNYMVNSEHFSTLITPFLRKINVQAIAKCRVNLYTNMGSLVKNDLHEDLPVSHKAFVYYINTNNGFTGFEDGSKVESVANRIVFFDGSKLHHSTTCTDEKRRLIISMNYF